MLCMVTQHWEGIVWSEGQREQWWKLVEGGLCLQPGAPSHGATVPILDISLRLPLHLCLTQRGEKPDSSPLRPSLLVPEWRTVSGPRTAPPSGTLQEGKIRRPHTAPTASPLPPPPPPQLPPPPPPPPQPTGPASQGPPGPSLQPGRMASTGS